jgi:tRNA-specific adenosine deaminase 1
MENYAVLERIMTLYGSLPLQPPPQQYTVLASFFLASNVTGHKIISVATGTKCLPSNKLPVDGESLHDSHAEVLARRGAVRWFLEEIRRCNTTNFAFESEWIYLCDGKYTLKADVRLILYISTVPCKTLRPPSYACSQRRVRALRWGCIHAFPLYLSGRANGRAERLGRPRAG